MLITGTPFSGAAGGCPFWAGALARARAQKALPEKNLEPPRHKNAKEFFFVSWRLGGKSLFDRNLIVLRGRRSVDRPQCAKPCPQSFTLTIFGCADGILDVQWNHICGFDGGLDLLHRKHYNLAVSPRTGGAIVKRMYFMNAKDIIGSGHHINF
jgi:hypothetical protein